MAKKVGYPLFIGLLAVALLIGAGAMYIIIQSSPATFVIFDADRSASQSQTISTTPADGGTAETARQTQVLEAGCTTPGLQLVNSDNGATLDFGAYSQVSRDEDGEFFLLVKRANNVVMSDPKAFFDGAAEGNLDNLYGASLTVSATKIRDNCSVDTLYYKDSFFEQLFPNLFEASEEEDLTLSDSALTASLLAFNPGGIPTKEWVDDPEEARAKCLDQGGSKLKCWAYFYAFKFWNGTKKFFDGFNDFFRGSEGDDGGNRPPPGGGGGDPGGSTRSCEAVDYSGRCAGITDPEACNNTREGTYQVCSFLSAGLGCTAREYETACNGSSEETCRQIPVCFVR